jgi:mono/diheme cytochrome c family protein
MYKGDKTKFGKEQLALMDKRKTTAPNIKTPGETKDNLEKEITARSAKMYNTYCAACHQTDGLGNDRFPPLSRSEWVTGDKKKLVSIILNGLEGPIVVKGKSYNNVMPAMGMLRTREIADIATYIRQNFNNNASPVTPEDIWRTREAERDSVRKLNQKSD